MPRILFGAAYYPEYQSADSLKPDLDLMSEAQFSVIRVGESVWSTWEPEDGQFALDWLQLTLDGAHERGIGVILGTPTCAVPPWPGSIRRSPARRRPAGGSVGAPGRRWTSLIRRSGSTPSASFAGLWSAMPPTQRSSVTRSTTSRARTCCTTTASSSAS